MYNDADIEMLELEDASRWMYCADCGDEVRRRGDETRCKRCSDTPPPAELEETTTYADEHECGQLRLAVPGEQVSLLPLPDSLIPTVDESQAVDYMADYREAQAAGHHVDCDGYGIAHRTEIRRTVHGTFETVCEECGKLGIGSSSSRETQAQMHAGHAQEVRCDGRCKAW